LDKTAKTENRTDRQSISIIDGAGQIEQDRQTEKTDRQNRTDRRKQDRQTETRQVDINKTDRQDIQTEQNTQNSTDRTGQTRLDRLEWTYRTGQDRIRLDWTGQDRTGQPLQDSHGRTAMKGQQGHG
jgi:hypothetical protein